MVFPSEINGWRIRKQSARRSVKTKMRERKLRSSVDCQGALKQKGITHSGVKQGLGVVSNLYSLRNYILNSTPPRQCRRKAEYAIPFTVCSNKRSCNSGQMQHRSVKADSHIACRAAKGLECVFPI